MELFSESKKKKTGKILAAKIFKDFYLLKGTGEEINLDEISRESDIYSKLQYPSIAKYIGLSPFDFEGEPFPCIILECYQTSLRSIIESKPPNFDNTKLLINLYGIASGCSYLHSKNIVYRDLKADNILEDANFYPKLSDFGCSKIISNENFAQTKSVGTPLYIAPESFNGIYSEKSDVYAYSLLVYELMMNERVAFPDCKYYYLLVTGVQDGKRPEFTKPIPDCYKKLITKCWSGEPDDRPTFSEITEILKNNREFVTELNVDENEYYSYIEMISNQVSHPSTKSPQLDKKFSQIEEDEDKPLSVNVPSLNLGNFIRKNQIGEGSFGIVYEVENSKNKIIYAAKISRSEIYECLKKEISTVNLIREVMILSKVKHPSIMKFIGFSPVNFKNNPKPVIITELLKNGTLEDVIELERKGLSGNLWNETKKLINIYGIASSMAYLHALRILHRDLKPANILVDDFLFPKLADFGLSKDLTCNSEECEQKNPTELIGTPIFIAPEIYNTMKYTKAGDVYAFGLIVYEIMTSEIPFIGDDRYQLMFNIVNGVRPKFNCEIPARYKTLIENCWDQNPKKRPSFADIVYDLKNDPEFITDLVVESEFLDYVDMIDNKLIANDKFEKIDISSRQKEDEKKYKNIFNENGLINIDDFSIQKRNGKNEFWKFYNVFNNRTHENFLAKMSIIPLPNFTEDETNNLIKEVAILSTLNHPSLLKFIGYSSINFKKKKPKPVIISEYVLKQTLENIIEMKRLNIILKEWNSTKVLINIYGIASGMAYLHSKNIIHNDLTPKNIFVDLNLYPKLTDYGFYTKFQIMKSISCQSTSKMKNIPNYSAPEILMSEKPTKASDVYSFAMIVYELLTKKKPFGRLKSTVKIFHEVVSKSRRPKFPTKEEIPPCFKELIIACWSQDPNQRPSFQDIVAKLENDSRFLCEDVNKEEFINYVKMIENISGVETKEYVNRGVETNEENENKDENHQSNELTKPSFSPEEQKKQEPEQKHQQSSFNQNNEEQNQLTSKKDEQQIIPSNETKIVELQKVEENENNDENHQSNELTKPSFSPDEQKNQEPEQKQQQSSFNQNNEEQNQLPIKMVTQQTHSTKKANIVEDGNSSASSLPTIYNEIRNIGSSTNWVLANFDNSTKNFLFYCKGSGGLEEMKENIPSDFIGYGYLKFEGRSRGINRTLFILIKYVSVGTKMMTKAFMNSKRGEIESIFDFRNIIIEAESKDELSEKINQNLK